MSFTFTEEVSSIDKLQKTKKYYSRSMNLEFQVLLLDRNLSKIQIGVGKTAKTLSIPLFCKQYLAEGAIEV